MKMSDKSRRDTIDDIKRSIIRFLAHAELVSQRTDESVQSMSCTLRNDLISKLDCPSLDQQFEQGVI